MQASLTRLHLCKKDSKLSEVAQRSTRLQCSITRTRCHYKICNNIVRHMVGPGKAWMAKYYNIICNNSFRDKDPIPNTWKARTRNHHLNNSKCQTNILLRCIMTLIRNNKFLNSKTSKDQSRKKLLSVMRDILILCFKWLNRTTASANEWTHIQEPEQLSEIPPTWLSK